MLTISILATAIGSTGLNSLRLNRGNENITTGKYFWVVTEERLIKPNKIEAKAKIEFSEKRFY